MEVPVRIELTPTRYKGVILPINEGTLLVPPQRIELCCNGM